MNRRTALCSTWAIMLSACASTPSAQLQNSAQNAQANTLDSLFNALGDAPEAKSDYAGLSELLESVVDRSLTLAVARSAARSASKESNTLERNNFGVGGSFDTSAAVKSAQLGVSWTSDFARAAELARSVQSKEVKFKAIAVSVAKTALALDLLSAVVSHRHSLLSLRLRTSSMTEVQSQERRLVRMQSLGLQSSVDADRFAPLLTEARQALLGAQHTLDESRLILEAVYGLSQSEIALLERKLLAANDLELTVQPLGHSSAVLPLLYRPDVLAALVEQQRQSDILTHSLTPVRPELRLDLSLNMTAQKLSQLLSSPLTALLSQTLSWSLSEQESWMRKREWRVSQHQEAIDRYRAAVWSAGADASVRLIQWRQALLVREDRTGAVSAAQSAVERFALREAIGLDAASQTFEAKLSLIQSQDSLLKSRTQASVCALNLVRACGGIPQGWVLS